MGMEQYGIYSLAGWDPHHFIHQCLSTSSSSIPTIGCCYLRSLPESSFDRWNKWIERPQIKAYILPFPMEDTDYRRLPLYTLDAEQTFGPIMEFRLVKAQTYLTVRVPHRDRPWDSVWINIAKLCRIYSRKTQMSSLWSYTLAWTWFCDWIR